MSGLEVCHAFFLLPESDGHGHGDPIDLCPRDNINQSIVKTTSLTRLIDTQVVAAVAAVVSAFHGGAELLKIVKEKRRTRKARDQAQQEWEEKLLQDSLVTGEQQISLRWAQDTRELGEYMRVGDGKSHISM